MCVRVRACYVCMFACDYIFQGGGNLVSTLKKSYSLSDLSEPDMQRSPDEVDDIMYGQMNQLMVYRQMSQPQPSSHHHHHHRSPYVKVLRAKNPNHSYSNGGSGGGGIHRSSSSSRTIDINYDNLMTRSSDNYE